MLARRTVNPAVRTARARRDPTVSYVRGWAQAPDIGRALLTTLRTVAGLRDRAPRPWTGSWTEPSVQPVRSGPSAARLRSIRAASAHDARGRSSHNPLVVGSSPTRPTRSNLFKHSEHPAGKVDCITLTPSKTLRPEPCPAGAYPGDVGGAGLMNDRGTGACPPDRAGAGHGKWVCYRVRRNHAVIAGQCRVGTMPIARQAYRAAPLGVLTLQRSSCTQPYPSS